MKLQVTTVHPAVTIVATENTEQELPTGWFPNRPTAGQNWELSLEPIGTLVEQYAQLNRYLSRD